jgi:hypothetical protein
MSRNLSLVDRQVSLSALHDFEFLEFCEYRSDGMENWSDWLHLSNSRFHIILTPAHKIQISSNMFIIASCSLNIFAFCSVSVMTKLVRPICNTGQTSMCLQSHICNPESIYHLL